MAKRFRVEQQAGADGCPTCGHGRLFTVIDTVTDTEDSIAFEDKGEAEDRAELMNSAYEMGKADAVRGKQ